VKDQDGEEPSAQRIERMGDELPGSAKRELKCAIGLPYPDKSGWLLKERDYGRGNSDRCQNKGNCGNYFERTGMSKPARLKPKYAAPKFSAVPSLFAARSYPGRCANAKRLA